MERSGSRALLPSARGVKGGALVGRTTAGNSREIRFPDDLLRRHHLYVARTRMGKSTLMHHIVSHKLREKAEGRETDAIVVVDPHADLVVGLLAQVPESLADKVKLIDLAEAWGAPGINLLDTRIFADRDRTADSVVRVMHGLWEQWGPRMQSILEHTVKSLHEANEQVEADRQYTILDGLSLIADAKFRREVLEKVYDPHLLRFWARDFLGWNRERRGEAIAPVQTRLAYYASSKKARAILGQSRSTIDIRQTILEGGVLLVSTARGSVGRDVSALVGASLLNLVDSVVREQESLPLHQRRGALVVVDEMQSTPGVDYESMLSELGKYGASFILATQSLAKLEDLSRTMRDTILANVGCLAVFQVAGSDARQLVWELGKDRVSEDDIVSLDVHHCYVRTTVGVERMPAFSMMVLKPEPGDEAVAARIRADASPTCGPTTPGTPRDAARSASTAGCWRTGRRAVARSSRGGMRPRLHPTATMPVTGSRTRSASTGGCWRRWRRTGNDTRRLRERYSPRPGRNALLGPPGTGRPNGAVPGCGLRSYRKADRVGDGVNHPPRFAADYPHLPLPSRRRGPARTGRRRGRHRQPTPHSPARFRPLAARIAGTPGRAGRHLPRRRRSLRLSLSHPVPVVPGRSGGRGNLPARRTLHRRGAPGQLRRPRHLRQAAVAAVRGGAPRRGAAAGSRRDPAAPGEPGPGLPAPAGFPGAGEGCRPRRGGWAGLAHALRPRPAEPARGPGLRASRWGTARRYAASPRIPSRRPRPGPPPETMFQPACCPLC